VAVDAGDRLAEIDQLLEIVHRSDFTIQLKPNIWPVSPNKCRIFGRTLSKVVAARHNVDTK